MNFVKANIAGVHLISLDEKKDNRGFFGRVFCRETFSEKGIAIDIAQINTSLSIKKGTIRGLHYQFGQFSETKIIRCINGSLYDVVLDLRPDSPTYRRWFGAELSANNRTMMYVPKGCAHGFVTLKENTEIFYFVDNVYSPLFERGIRYDDPAFNINWPIRPNEISKKDEEWPDFNPQWHKVEMLKGLL